MTIPKDQFDLFSQPFKVVEKRACDPVWSLREYNNYPEPTYSNFLKEFPNKAAAKRYTDTYGIRFIDSPSK